MSPRAFVVLIAVVLIVAGFVSIVVAPALSPALPWTLWALGVLTLIGSTVRSKRS